MKATSLTVLGCLAISLVASAADKPVKVTLVKLVDREEKETFQVLESQALTALQEEIKIEERLYDKAIQLTEKAWRLDESTKSKSFPRGSIGHRSCTVINSYLKREDADKALAAQEEKVARAEENRMEAEKKREDTRRAMGSNNSYVPKKKDTKVADAAKKALELQAISMFNSKMEELKKGKPADEKAPAEGQNPNPNAVPGGAAPAGPDAKAPPAHR